MLKSATIRLLTAAFLVAAFASAQAAAQLQDLVSADAEFRFSGERDLWVQLSVFDVEGAPADLTTVEILEAGDAMGQGARLLEKGLTDASGAFERQIRIPATAKQLTVRVGVLGIANIVTLTLDDSGVVSHAFQ